MPSIAFFIGRYASRRLDDRRQEVGVEVRNLELSKIGAMDTTDRGVRVKSLRARGERRLEELIRTDVVEQGAVLATCQEGFVLRAQRDVLLVAP